jgi:hypothetical protein
MKPPSPPAIAVPSWFRVRTLTAEVLKDGQGKAPIYLIRPDLFGVARRNSTARVWIWVVVVVLGGFYYRSSRQKTLERRRPNSGKAGDEAPAQALSAFGGVRRYKGDLPVYLNGLER